MKHAPGTITAVSAALLLARCAGPAIAPATAVDAAECVSRLRGAGDPSLGSLDSRDIEVVSWNVQRGRKAGWVSDLAATATGPDLLILQEAVPGARWWRDPAPGLFESFAEGFGDDRAPTGVMTISAAEPLTVCELVDHEPWFGTRKATLVTEYGLSGSTDTLLVVNIHGINFSFGVVDLEAQYDAARAVIAAHRGPVLFSGDFNTWRSGRTRVLEIVAANLDMVPVVYDDDRRKRFFGTPLDHVYVRGLETLRAETPDVASSDHNPIAVTLRLPRAKSGNGAAR